MFNVIFNAGAAIINLIAVLTAIYKGSFGIMNYLNFFFVFFSSYISFLCYVGYRMEIDIFKAHKLVFAKFIEWGNGK